ncbi:MAG TPA: hypothetical protein VHN99_06195, partial [Deinococcales bacterium]|nr:hypothetical protein [Deinococcales bacterium]
LLDVATALQGTLDKLAGRPTANPDPAPLTARLLASIRAAANGSDEARRSWGRLIVDLGTADGEGEDLLDPNLNLASAGLTPLQVGLVLTRLGAELGAAAAPAGAARFRPQANEKACTFTGTEGTIMDAAALVSGKVYGPVLDYLDEAYSGLGLSLKLTLANTILTYAKLLWTNAAFQATVSLDGEALTRTKSTAAPGERRTLRTHASLDMGNAQLINCFRIILNAAGLDFSVNNDGPLGGVGVSWVLTDGGTSGSTPGIVQFVGGDPTRQATNDNGDSQFDIEGRQQPQDLGQHPKPVEKSAAVRALYTLKGANLFQDFVDAGGGTGTLIAMPAELIYRTRWFFYADHDFPVTDWEPCPECSGWSGTIQYSMNGEKSWDVAPRTGTNTGSWKHTETATVSGVSSQSQGVAHLILSVTSSVQERHDMSTQLQYHDKCTSSGSVILREFWSDQLHLNLNGTGSSTEELTLILNDDGSYEGYYNSIGAHTTGTETGMSHWEENCFGYSTDTPTDKTFDLPGFGGNFPVTLKGTVDPKDPNHLQGSVPIEPHTEGLTAIESSGTLTWNLTRN